MNTEQNQLIDYLRILENNQAVEDGHTEKRHIHINATTAELFAMMVTARALVEISETLKDIYKVM